MTGAVEVEVLVGVDMAKGDHYAQAITSHGEELFDQPVANDQAALEAMIDQAASKGRVGLVIDMTASGAQLLLSVAAARGVPVAYVTGLQMRRAAELYAGAAKTDPRDAWVLADFARRNTDRLTWLDVTDELLVRLRVLNGRDVDLATDANRVINRCRDALVAVSPALERSIGDRWKATAEIHADRQLSARLRQPIGAAGDHSERQRHSHAPLVDPSRDVPSRRA